MKNLKKGISLIVLVITIIIIIILAGAVILNLANNNPIESASKAKIASDIDTFRSELTLYIGTRYVQDRTFDEEELNGLSGDALEAALPSMKNQTVGNKKYSEVLTISNGQLVMQDDSTIPSDFDAKTKQTLEEIFSGAKSAADVENVITAAMVKSDSSYIGQTVTYTGYDEATVNQDIVWKIFGVDKNTNKILLIADDYLDLSYKSAAAASSGITVSGYNIYASNDSGHTRDTLINYLKTSSNWSEYAISGKTTAYGAPTWEQFEESYKIKYLDKYLIGTYYATQEVATSAGRNAPGWVLRFSDESTDAYYKNIGTTDNFYVKTNTTYGLVNTYAYWLASPSANSATSVMDVVYSGTLGDCTFSYTNYGVRPVVSLDSNIKLVEKNGVYTVK